MFSLICVWINGWEINREAGALRRYRAHYDVIVLWQLLTLAPSVSDIHYQRRRYARTSGLPLQRLVPLINLLPLACRSIFKPFYKLWSICNVCIVKYRVGILIQAFHSSTFHKRRLESNKWYHDGIDDADDDTDDGGNDDGPSVVVAVEYLINKEWLNQHRAWGMGS